jgi:hypothetical protein
MYLKGMKTTVQIKVLETAEVITAQIVAGRDEFAVAEDLDLGTVSIYARHVTNVVAYETLYTCARGVDTKAAALAVLARLARGMDEDEIVDAMSVELSLLRSARKSCAALVARYAA